MLTSSQAVPEGIYGGRADKNREAGVWHNYYRNNTYKGLRIVSEEYSIYYSVWCTNETEFFDLKVCKYDEMCTSWELTIFKSDQYQIQNLAAPGNKPPAYQIAGRPLDQILTRLNALIMVLKTCKDRLCTYPWESLHPDGSVRSLKQALNGRFDEFYSNQPQMWFSDCSLGYFMEAENQDPVRAFETTPKLQKQAYDWVNHWHHFT